MQDIFQNTKNYASSSSSLPPHKASFTRFLRSAEVIQDILLVGVVGDTIRLEVSQKVVGDLFCLENKRKASIWVKVIILENYSCLQK
jgi:hypothetical protein